MGKLRDKDIIQHIARFVQDCLDDVIQVKRGDVTIRGVKLTYTVEGSSARGFISYDISSGETRRSGTVTVSMSIKREV